MDRVIKDTVAEAAARKRVSADHEAALQIDVQQHAQENATSSLAKRGLLEANAKSMCEWFGVPGACERLLAASGAKFGAARAEGDTVESLDAAWHTRHLGIRRAHAQRVRTRPPQLCVSPGGCVCSGSSKKLYNSVAKAVKTSDPDSLRFNRVVMSLEMIGVEGAAKDEVETGPTMHTRWFHVSYVCLKPWRATLVELEIVDAMANPVVAEGPLVNPFVRPTFRENAPSVLPLQCLVNDMDHDWGYRITCYSLSSSAAPMPVLRGHARIGSPGAPQVVWRGLEAEALASRGVTKRRRMSKKGLDKVAEPAVAEAGVGGGNAGIPSRCFW